MRTALARLIPVALLLVAGCGGDKQPATAPPPPAPSGRPIPAATVGKANFIPGERLTAVVGSERAPIAQQMANLKAIAEWARGKGLAGTPFFFVYDGPCDGNVNSWTADAGWLLAAPPPAGFDPAPYEVRSFAAPSPKVSQAVVPGASLQTLQSSACAQIAVAEREYHKLPGEARWFHFAMNSVILHGMKNFTLDEPVTVEVREPHYELTAEGKMPGPIMPTPFPEPPKVEPPPAPPAPVPAPAPKRKGPPKKKAAPAPKAAPASAPK